jgi:PEP-CTERM motif
MSMTIKSELEQGQFASCSGRTNLSEWEHLIKHQMKSKTPSIIIGATLCLAFVSGTFVQTVNATEPQPDNSMLYLPNVNLTSLSQNNFSGIVGGIFYTPYYYNVNVNYLGYADPTGAALTDSHTVTLWDQANGNVVASAVVPAGAPTLLENGYAWVPLSSTVTLSYQHYYWVGATVVGGVDPWGDLIVNNSPDPGNNGQITWNVENGSWSGDPNSSFVQAGSGWEFTRAGIYDGNTGDAGNPNPSFGQTSAQDSIYPAANLGYNLVAVPEPTTLGLLGIGAAMFFGIGRGRKN